MLLTFRKLAYLSKTFLSWSSTRPIKIDNVDQTLRHKGFSKCTDAAMVSKKQDLVRLAELEIRMNHEVRLAVVGIDLTEAV